MPFCRKCGNQIKDNVRYCPKCGNDALQRCGKDSGSKWTNKLINR